MNKTLLLILTILVSLTAFSFFRDGTITISGIVTDENNHPVQGISVIEKGTNNATVTDSAGFYRLAVTHAGAIISFSGIGYNNREIKATRTIVKNIALKPTVSKLEEVAVIGYGETDSQYYNYRVAKTGSRSYFMAPGIYNHENDNEPRPESREGYENIDENRFKKVTDNPLSTFSIDVDAASYSNVRRFIQNGQLPPAGAVRIEEMVNYFHYDYPQPSGDDPFSINTEITGCPWNNKHQLALIGLQGKLIPTENLPASNLVFLIDVSGSMDEPNKLPLVQSSLKLLVQQLRSSDKVSIAVYAGNAGLVLPVTPGSEKNKIVQAIDNLQAGGSTAGGEGIQLAYKTARANFSKEGNNRVILCTDGDFNVGLSSDDALERMIEKERGSGIYLSVLGFGMGNYQDAKMQKLADKGNGNHSYIDDIGEARKVLVNEFGGTLFTIAKDVKLQVEFNPAKVQGYRLIGYENRMLNKEDFNNDKKDAGELGSGHTVTALYEIIPAGIKDEALDSVDELKYQQPNKPIAGGDEMMTIKFRYKEPADSTSKLMVHVVKNETKRPGNASENIRFAAAVAEFGLLLRNSAFKQDASYSKVLNMARASMGKDAEGYRRDFIKMVENASQLTGNNNDEDLGIN